MSREGIKIAAKAFQQLQAIRGELIALGCGLRDSGTSATKSGHQDIMLGHMLQKATDAVKDEFCKLTMMETEDRPKE